MITATNKLIQKGIQKGIDQGRREREEELLKRWRGLTQSLLEERFGPLPDGVTARVAAANADALEQWTGRIHKSKTLDEVFAPTP